MWNVSTIHLLKGYKRRHFGYRKGWIFITVSSCWTSSRSLPGSVPLDDCFPSPRSWDSSSFLSPLVLSLVECSHVGFYRSTLNGVNSHTHNASNKLQSLSRERWNRTVLASRWFDPIPAQETLLSMNPIYFCRKSRSTGYKQFDFANGIQEFGECKAKILMMLTFW